MVRLGVLTIGQSPRTELVEDLRRWLPAGTEIVEAGVLDGLDLPQVLALAPVSGDPADAHVLTTSLPDGTTVVLAERHVVDRLPAALAQLEGQVDLTFLVCTGTFPEFPHAKPLVSPEDLITAGVVGLAAGAVGVICPLPEQVDTTRRKIGPRLAPGTTLHVEVASPYTATAEEMSAAARRLAAAGAELVALDCMGYTDISRAIVARAAGVPVVVARSVAARLVAELVDSAAASSDTAPSLAPTTAR
ncbi:MAG: AroM family protein [Pseudonocardia sp.]|nr:AroM family protein [Pseudonocardia sp.]